MKGCYKVKAEFTEKHKNSGLHEIELEDLTLYAESIEGEKGLYKLHGSAIVDGERYPDFTVVFKTEKIPAEETIEEIMNSDWDWYDYEFIV